MAVAAGDEASSYIVMLIISAVYDRWHENKIKPPGFLVEEQQLKRWRHSRYDDVPRRENPAAPCHQCRCYHRGGEISRRLLQ